ncbi:hypothetical protein CSA37_10890 [Candidatus Fermentibacteria bacterium]|nr:MAG: hypothetical protein CSA37_10890 [Candidatus Fermentibacteria bacterium]
MARKGKFKQLLPILLPILLPLGLLLGYLVRESFGQLNDPVQILASIDPSGDGTAYLSTILPDGAQAQWTCTSGRFVSTDSTMAFGRSVTWQASPGFADSVTVVVTTPSATDSIRFLPVILEVTPTITVSSAYHLAILERTRSLSLPAGSYSVSVEEDQLTGYDGLTILIAHFPGGVREAWSLFPGDSITVDLPLGAEFEAVALDNLDGALDNAGSIFIRFVSDREGSAELLEELQEEEQEEEKNETAEELPEPEEEQTDTLAVEALEDSVPVMPDIYIPADSVMEDGLIEDTVLLETDTLQEDILPDTLPSAI